MNQFLLPDQVPVSWGRVDQSGEGGTNAARIDGSGLETYNYLMHQALIPAPGDISLQTRLRVRLVAMNVSNPSFEGAAVLHRGFKMSGTSPDLKLDTQVWSSNPAAGGRRSWISGEHADLRTYNFVIPVPKTEGMDYVTWELVVRAPGQIIVDDVQCRHFYGKPYDLDILGSQSFFANQLSSETFADFDQTNITRFVKYLKTETIECRKGQVIIANSTGAMRAAVINQDAADIPVISGFMLKLRREGTSTEDTMDASGTYTTTIKRGLYASYDETRQRRARYDYDRVQLVAYTDPQTRPTDSSVIADEISFINPFMDLLIADFVGPSQ